MHPAYARTETYSDISINTHWIVREEQRKPDNYKHA